MRKDINIVLLEKSPIAFVVLKTIVTECINIDKISNEYKRAFRVFNISDIKMESNLYSLTSQINTENQIRYYTYDRLIRSFVSIMELLQTEFSEIKINIDGYQFLDSGTELFFKEMTPKYTDFLKLKITTGSTNCESAQKVILSKQEQEISNLLAKNSIDRKKFNFLVDKADYYINIGDFITGISILTELEKYDTNPRIYSLLAIAYTMYNKTVYAKNYLDKWYKYGTLYDKASACYSYSMLYARYAEEKNFLKAEEYIDKGYSYLMQLKCVDNDQLVRDKLFNRNGYALFLFKQGKIDEAISLVENAIDILRPMKGERSKLQFSVMLYNLGQCYTQIKEYGKSIEIYKELIELDPNFPEYRLELAKNYINIELFDKARNSLLQAYEIDPFFADTCSLLGFFYYEQGEYIEAEKYYFQALKLDHSLDNIHDYLLVLSAQNKYNQIKEYTEYKNIDINYLLTEGYELINLIAEMYVNTDNKELAINLLNRAVIAYENNIEFKENLKLLGQ